MFSKALLASLLVSAVVAAPAPAAGDVATPPIIKLNSNVSCTSVVASSSNPGPSQSIILLNGPSAPPPVATGNYNNYAAPVQPPVSPTQVIKLNRRQFGPAPSTNSFSFGGIVPSSTPASSPPSLSTPTTTTTTSSAQSSTTSPNPAVPGGPATFTNKGADGIETVLILSTVTVTASGPPCSPSSAVPSSGLAPGFPPPQFSATSSSVLPPIVPSSSSPVISSPSPSLAGAIAQNPVPVIPSTVVTSSLSDIILNTPSVIPTATSTGFSLSSVSTANPTSTPFPVNATPPTNCDFACLLTASV